MTFQGIKLAFQSPLNNNNNFFKKLITVTKSEMWLSHFTEIDHLVNWNVFSLNPKFFSLNHLGQLIPEVFQAENPHATDGYAPKQGMRKFPLQ